jgi:hypothetical protein
MQRRTSYTLYFAAPVAVGDMAWSRVVGPFETAKEADDWCKDYELDNGRHLPALDTIEIKDVMTH